MNLSKIQIKLLRQYERFHTESVTISGILRACCVPWLALLAAAVFSYWILSAIGIPSPFSLLPACICLGAWLRDIGRAQVLVRTWPVMQEVINWERVRQLVQTDDTVKH